MISKARKGEERTPPLPMSPYGTSALPKGVAPIPPVGFPEPPLQTIPQPLQTLHTFFLSRGFSLVELMIVVAIMAILMGMAFLTFRGNADRQSVTQTRIRIARFLSDARGVAISKGMVVAVYLDPSLNTLTSFLWADSTFNYRLDWTDTNGNGLLDPGEGEVLEVYDRIQLGTGRGEGMGGRRIRLLTAPPSLPAPPDPQAQQVGCNIPAGSSDPNPEPYLVLFTPTGNILNSEGFPCADYVVYIQLDQPIPQYSSKIRVRASGYVESYDIFG